MNDENALRVRSTKIIKLKNYPASRRIIYIDMMRAFRFVPDNIIIEKTDGHDKFMVHAVLTQEEIDKEDKKIEEEKKEQDKLKSLEKK